MATGDLKNNLRRLQSKLKLINYPKDMDMKGISKGLAQEFLPLLHYILLDFSRPMAEHIVNNDMELFGKSDEKFMAAVYKVLRDIFRYKPSITRQQFFSRGFAEHKIILVVDLIRMVKEKHKELSKGSLGTRHASGSLARLRGTPSREQVNAASTKSVTDPDQPTTPDLLTASSSEVPVFLPTTTEASKVTERDTGYHTAETSPTIKSPDDQDAKRVTVSVNELRAKFESSGLPKQDSLESKLSDIELEESPVIQALVKQIVHLEDQLTEMSEETQSWKAQVEKMQSDMQARMMLMQNSILLLESKVPTGQAEGKPVRSVLTQGIAQEAAMALLQPIRRRPEDIPLPDSPAIPRTPNHTPSSAKSPLPPLSISAVASDQDALISCQEDLSVQLQKELAMPEVAPEPSRYQHRPVSVVGPIQTPMMDRSEPPEPEVVTVLGATSPSPMDTEWMHRSSSTPIEATDEEVSRRRGVETEAEATASNDDDDIDEGLVDVEDGDLGDYIVETARDYSSEMPANGGDVSEADEAEEFELEEDEIDEVPVRDVGQTGVSVDAQDATDGISSQMQRVQDMLVTTQQMLTMNTSLTNDSSPEED